MSNANFAETAVRHISESMESIDRPVSFMLTGGRSVEPVYRNLNARSEIKNHPINFYFGDERCLPLDHEDSNFQAVSRTLFAGGVPANCRVEPMLADSPDSDAELKRYASILPTSLDVVLLSVGDDGHIASLFPDSPHLFEFERSVVKVTNSPKPPKERFSITPKVIREAGSVFVLAVGAERGRILAKALDEPTRIQDLPVRLTLGRTWILDAEAYKAFRLHIKNESEHTRIIHE